jgi:hypothetical protein
MRRAEARLLLGASVALLAALGSPSLAVAHGDYVKEAEHAIDLAIHDEQLALALETKSKKAANSKLEGSEAQLAFAIGDIEKALAAGEIEPTLAAEVVLDLRDAAHEDELAEDLTGKLSAGRRKTHIRLAIAHKRRSRRPLTQIQTTLSGTPVAHEDTPPPTSSPITMGSSLGAAPEPDLGNIAADSETLNRIEKELLEKLKKSTSGAAAALFDPFLAHASAAGATSVITASGQITSYTVKGYTISSNRPGPGGSGEVRLGVDEPQPNGQVKVLSTSNPPNLLPHAPGTYTFQIGPPSTGFKMPVTKGDVVSFDTPGGDYAVFGSQPGAELLASQGTGLEQNPGVLWTLTPHPNIELLMQVTVVPSIPLAKLEEAEKLLKEALALEHAAAKAGRKQFSHRLKGASTLLKKATELIAGAKGEGAVSDQTAASIDYYLGNAAADVKDALSMKRGPKPQTFAFGSAVETQDALTRVGTAKSLAKSAP